MSRPSLRVWVCIHVDCEVNEHNLSLERNSSDGHQKIMSVCPAISRSSALSRFTPLALPISDPSFHLQIFHLRRFVIYFAYAGISQFRFRELWNLGKTSRHKTGLQLKLRLGRISAVPPYPTFFRWYAFHASRYFTPFVHAPFTCLPIVSGWYPVKMRHVSSLMQYFNTSNIHTHH